MSKNIIVGMKVQGILCKRGDAKDVGENRFLVIFGRTAHGSISADNFETVGPIKCEVLEGWEKLILDKTERMGEKDQGNLFETF